MRAMIIIALLILLAAVSIFAGGSGEVLYLKDGSIFKGTLIRITETTVIFESSFGSRLEVPRESVARIVFSGDLRTPSKIESMDTTHQSPGSLYVDFGNTKLTSKISVFRNKDLEGSLRANSIEQALYVDGELVFSHIDSIQDKEIRKGPERIFKNTIVLQNIKVQIPSGPHQIRLVVKAIDGSAYEGRFESKPLLQTLESHNMIIYPERTSQIDVRLRKRRWGLSGSEFYIRG